MKKFFQLLGLFALVCGSFFYTEKTVSVVRDMDEIMIQIKEQAEIDKTDAIDARIDGDMVIPGKSGREIDIDQSYQKMKQYGAYTPKLLVYEQVKPARSIDQYYHKYVVGGNPSKNQATIIFLVDEKSDLTKIKKIMNQEEVKANYFVDGMWLEQNNEEMIQLIEEGNIIGNLSYQRDYTNSSFVWMDTIIRRVGEQKQGYCYAENKDKKVIDNCKLQKNFTILPNLITKEHPFSEVKEKLQPGSIISLAINQTTEEQLLSIVRYIKSRGYAIVTLNELLHE